MCAGSGGIRKPLKQSMTYEEIVEEVDDGSPEGMTLDSFPTLT